MTFGQKQSKHYYVNVQYKNYIIQNLKKDLEVKIFNRFIIFRIYKKMQTIKFALIWHRKLYEII